MEVPLCQLLNIRQAQAKTPTCHSHRDMPHPWFFNKPTVVCSSVWHTILRTYPLLQLFHVSVTLVPN